MNVSLGKAKGAPRPKNKNVIIIKVDDIAQDAALNYTGFPATDAKGVKMIGNFVLKAGAAALAIYMTPSTIDRNDAPDGEGSASGYISNFAGEHPGDSLEINEFATEYLDEDVIIITRECANETGVRVQGTPCNPMKLQMTGQDNNEAVKKMITFKQEMRDGKQMGHYSGTIPELLPFIDDSSSSGSGI